MSTMPSWLGKQAIICPYCNTRNSLGRAFCTKCGKELSIYRKTEDDTKR